MVHPRRFWSKRSFTRLLVWVCLLAAASYVVCDTPQAEARSGSSFGGGFRSRSSSSSSSRSFGSSSSRSFGSSSSSSRSSSTYSPSRSSGSSSWGSSGGWNSRRSTTYVPVPVPIGRSYGPLPSATNYQNVSPSLGWSALLPFVLWIVFFVLLILAIRHFRRKNAGDSGSETTYQADVSMLQLGILHTARDLQDVLEQLAAGASSGTEAALAGALSGAVSNILSRAEFIEYAYAARQPGLSLPKAEEHFMWLAQNERAKYNREVLRIDASGTKTQQKEWKTDGIRDEDGQLAVHEFFVVTLLVASRGRPFPTLVQTPAQVEEALLALQSVDAAHLVALEVIWSPSARSDAMSREDLESRYPELRQL